MGKFIDITGLRFGRLTVLNRGTNGRNGKPRWVCQCDCGGNALTFGSLLKSGATSSCGCLQRERASAAAKISSRTHGLTNTPEHRSWRAMINRCTNPNATGYERYGGCGITICERWAKSFSNFFADMGPRPTLAHTLDRIDKNGNYTPDNCRWANKEEQGNNRRDNRMVSFRGKTMTLSRAMRIAGAVSKDQAWKRIQRGWTADLAITTPATR